MIYVRKFEIDGRRDESWNVSLARQINQVLNEYNDPRLVSVQLIPSGTVAGGMMYGSQAGHVMLVIDDPDED